MEEYAIYFVSDDGEWDRSPIDLFDNYEEADCHAHTLRRQYPDIDGDFVVVEN